MRPSFADGSRLRAWWPIVLAVALPALAALLRGIDSNWDLRNYHLYGPHAWLHGRAAIDIAPAQLQGFHNPLLDLPLYLLVSSGAPPRLATLWLALPTMLSLWLLLRLQALLAPARTGPPSPLSQGVLALLALGGAAAWSGLASSMNDAFVAAGILLALWLVLAQPLPAAATRRWFVAGLVAGAIAGLKLTAFFYCLALACAALPGGDWGARLRRLALLGAGGVLGVAATYGWWAWHLQATQGSPVFPYFNDWFHSAQAPSHDFVDTRFRPHGWRDTLLVPVHLLHKSMRYSELWLRDPRLLLGLVSFAGLLAWRARTRPDANANANADVNASASAHADAADAAAPATAQRLRMLALFFVVALVLWARQYGIYRYAIVLELLACLALVTLLSRLPAWRRTALIVALVLVSVATRRPDWGRDAQALPRAGIAAPDLGAGALVVTATGDPLAYLALGLPDDVPMLGVSNNLMAPADCTGLRRAADARLAAHAGPVWLLVDPSLPDVAPAKALLASRYGLAAAGACRDWPNALGPASLCPLRRVGPAHPPACPVVPAR
jgi:hypothetical protein